MKEPDFAAEVALCKAIHYWKASAEVTAEVTALVAALGSDTTTHDRTIEAPAAASALVIGPPNGLVAPAAGWKTRFGNDMILLINEAKAGNLSNPQIIAGIDDTFGIPHAPVNVAVPYAQAAGSPIVGAVCSCTQGQWTSSPTSYTYQWTRDGANIAGATAATYTLVSADVPAHAIRCVVTAINATGSTPAPASNAIAT